MGLANPPRYGEGDHAEHGGGGYRHQARLREEASPHHHPSGGPPPRSGEDLRRTSPQPRQSRRQPLRLSRMMGEVGARLFNRLGLGLFNKGRIGEAAFE